jgi:hypothetical protein
MAVVLQYPWYYSVAGTVRWMGLRELEDDD